MGKYGRIYKLRALIPMAGEGSRFVAAGYTFPKPLIDVGGSPMIEVVVESLPECDEYIFLCRKEHLQQYDMEAMLQRITDDKAKIVVVDQLTEGAACTALLAKELINDDEELIIANSDQYVDFDKVNFETMRMHTKADGIIFTFVASHPKWSFVELDGSNRVIRVEEKVPISNVATCGIYYWSTGSFFVRCAEEMIAKDIRTNGEFYIAPVYNQAGPTIVLPFFVDQMYGLGTPEDLEAYLRD